MVQRAFAQRVVEHLEPDPEVLGLAAGGSWITGELDAYSDLDLVLVTRTNLATDPQRMKSYAAQLGDLLECFTGEHVGEPRLLICLYDSPLLHVDLKFVTLEGFAKRIEDPFLLLDKEGLLKEALERSSARFPYPDMQWIEDRFWVWVHYSLSKIGRGEYLEATEGIGFLRSVVLGPLIHWTRGSLPRGLRKLEMLLNAEDLQAVHATIPGPFRDELLESLRASVQMYRILREQVPSTDWKRKDRVEQRVMQYFEQIESRQVL